MDGSEYIQCSERKPVGFGVCGIHEVDGGLGVIGGCSGSGEIGGWSGEVGGRSGETGGWSG